jgi:hypothetical protein
MEDAAMKSFTVLAVVACALATATTATAASGPPRNDDRANATALEGLPATVSGTTVGATEETRDPRTSCGRVRGTVWYRVSAGSSGRLVLRFTASGDLDAIVSVYRAVRSRLDPLVCTRPMNAAGVASPSRPRRDRAT